MENLTKQMQTLILYAICVPLALLVGYLLAVPLDVSSFSTLGLLALVLCLPLVLRWQQALLLMAWNCTMVLFFAPGNPPLWMAMVIAVLTLAMVRRTFDPRFHFISAPELTGPMVALLVVVIATAELTGGIGFQSVGGSTGGGRRYIMLLLSILGYFALTAQRIHPRRAGFMTGCFLLGNATAVIGDFFPIAPNSLRRLFLLFPPNDLSGSFDIGSTRLSGLGTACATVFFYLLARYGIRGIFFSRHRWLPWFFFAVLIGGMLGGFRSTLIAMLMVFGFQFFFEGVRRSKILMLGLLVLLLGAPPVFVYSQQLPRVVQRAISFLPVKIDPDISKETADSTEWRKEVWRQVIPDVPKYLLLGKGLAMSGQDISDASQSLSGVIRDRVQWALLSGDYHSGPLSVIIPFGIWGGLAFLWFIIACGRALWLNYRFGHPRLHSINTYLWASYLVHVIMFFFVVGAFQYDMLTFTGLAGLSVSLNWGVQKPVLLRIRRPIVPFGRQAAKNTGTPDFSKG